MKETKGKGKDLAIALADLRLGVWTLKSSPRPPGGQAPRVVASGRAPVAGTLTPSLVGVVAHWSEWIGQKSEWIARFLSSLISPSGTHETDAYSTVSST